MAPELAVVADITLSPSQVDQRRFTYALRNDIHLEDYVCGEPHRNISGVTGARRP